MIKDELMTIEIDKNENGYIIKDINKAKVGKFQIIEYSKENKNCSFRISLYNENKGLLKGAIKKFVQMLFTNAKVYKISIFVREDYMIQELIDLNFHIEGYMKDNIIYKEKFYNEMILCIDYETYLGIIHEKHVELRGDRIKIEILTSKDSVELLNYYEKNKKHLEIYEELREESFYTVERQNKIIMQQYSEFLNGRNMFCGIFKDNHIIGIIQMYNILWGIHKSAIVGYSIDEENEGKGYMKEAIRLIEDYAFNKLKLHRLEAATLVNNERSKHVLRSCGFKEIGVSKEYMFIYGSWQDHCIFSKVNSLYKS